MATLKVAVKPFNPGVVKVKVWTYASPGPSFDQTFEATVDNPVNETLEVEDGHYAVTISWTDGYHNIASGVEGNHLSYNDNNLYYQVLGKPADANGVMATFNVS